MTTATDLASLKARCTKLEQRATAAEARSVAQDVTIESLGKKVDDLHYIITSSIGRKSLLSTAASGRLTSTSSFLTRTVPPTQYYNVKTEGGAHGDGVSDDRQHILDAIVEYKRLMRFYLYFPMGTYYISSPIVMPANTKFMGVSEETTWIKGTVTLGEGCLINRIRTGL